METGSRPEEGRTDSKQELKPIPIERNVHILRSWIVNDPTGKWREYTYSKRIPKNKDQMPVWIFSVFGDNLSGYELYNFIIPVTDNKSQLWVQQEKDQWVISEYLDMGGEDTREKVRKWRNSY